MGNSIIEAQLTLAEESLKEMERCKDPFYFIQNYYSMGKRKIVLRDNSLPSISVENQMKARAFLRAGLMGTPAEIERIVKAQYPLIPDECIPPIKELYSGIDKNYEPRRTRRNRF